MRLEELMDRYFGQVDIEDAEFYPIEEFCDDPAEGLPDAASILLSIPKKILIEYSAIKGLGGSLPDGVEFWKDTKMVDLIEKTEKYKGVAYGECHEPILDITCWLKGEVYAEYQDMKDPEFVRLEIYENVRKSEYIPAQFS
jgi:hypothetical protein